MAIGLLTRQPAREQSDRANTRHVSSQSGTGRHVTFAAGPGARRTSTGTLPQHLYTKTKPPCKMRVSVWGTCAWVIYCLIRSTVQGSVVKQRHVCELALPLRRQCTASVSTQGCAASETVHCLLQGAARCNSSNKQARESGAVSGSAARPPPPLRPGRRGQGGPSTMLGAGEGGAGSSRLWQALGPGVVEPAPAASCC